MTTRCGGRDRPASELADCRMRHPIKTAATWLSTPSSLGPLYGRSCESTTPSGVLVLAYVTDQLGREVRVSLVF